MKDCCGGKADELAELRQRQSGVLKAVLAINAVMFVVELSGGLMTRSSALLADSLDMLGDASVYALSLYAVHRGSRWQAGAALVKGWVMAITALAVLVAAGYRAYQGSVPEAPEMGAVAGLALAANLVCLALLFRHRGDNMNLRSTWLCSRNDILANTAVLAAAAGVRVLGRSYPDLLVALGIAAVFAASGFGVIREAGAELSRSRLESA